MTCCSETGVTRLSCAATPSALAASLSTAKMERPASGPTGVMPRPAATSGRWSSSHRRLALCASRAFSRCWLCSLRGSSTPKKTLLESRTAAPASTSPRSLTARSAHQPARPFMAIAPAAARRASCLGRYRWTVPAMAVLRPAGVVDSLQFLPYLRPAPALLVHLAHSLRSPTARPC